VIPTDRFESELVSRPSYIGPKRSLSTRGGSIEFRPAKRVGFIARDSDDYGHCSYLYPHVNGNRFRERPDDLNTVSPCSMASGVPTSTYVLF
jgi:hypothetical protein